MGIYKTETKKMEFNGYSYKAEWTIDNFLSFIGNDYNSPLFSAENFQVQLSIKNSLSKSNDGLEITFDFISIPASGLSLNYILTIENSDSQKSEKIDGDEVLSNSKKEFNIFSKTQSNLITAENGFIQDGALKISCFFHDNAGIDADASSMLNHDKIKKEVIAEVNWVIKESLGEFHSTEEPLQVPINDKILSFALTFELTEQNTYSLNMILIEPEFSFSGEMMISLINLKDNQQTIKKTKKLRFDSILYELDPIPFDGITQDDFMNPENGWITLDDNMKDIKSGLHFNIQFISVQKEEESKESILSRLLQMQIYNEKELRENIPKKIEPKGTNKYNFEVVFPKILEQDLNQTISSSEYFTGGICEIYKLDFPSKTFYFEITDFPQSGSFMSAQITFINRDPSKSVTVKLSFLYCASKLVETKEIPFSLQDLKNPDKGWVTNGKLKIKAQFEAKNYSKSYLYPVSSNASSNDLYGFRFLIPMKLFSPDNESKIIDFPPVNSKKLTVTPFISYKYDEKNRLNIQTNFDINIPKEECIIDFIFAYENKNQDKNFVSTYTDVENDHLQMPLFVPETTFEDDGFVFPSKSKQVLHLYLRMHYKEKNSYSAVYSDPSTSVLQYEERRVQDESKMTAMLPDKKLSADQQTTQHHQVSKADYFDKYIDDYQSFDINNNDDDAITGPHDFTSKKETGYVGLKNQGATCYMNSLLQSLYHIPAFRRLVYEMPTTGSEDPNTSIPLNLQRLFCKMQFSDRTCSTVNLTKSFGWGSAETFQQHDIEEFLRVLIDNLENKMKTTNLKDSIPHLFRGKYRSYIKCLNIDYQSVREEIFYDLAMDVKGIPNLMESFNNYVKQEYLTGDNQYNAEGNGLQDAIMGTEFIEFPPVLHLHLRRFMYDYNLTNKMYKINDKFVFPQSIDLTEYLAKDSPSREKSNIYDLYGVLVHQGGVFGGHYYAFLRTSTSQQWYKFNDSIVTKDTADHAIIDNYGYSPNSPIQSNTNNDNDSSSSDNEENDFNEELDEIVNDQERMLTKVQSAQMSIDVCGRTEEDDIHISGNGNDLSDWPKHYQDVIERDHYREDLKRDYRKRHEKRRRAPHSSSSSNQSERTYSGYMLVYIRRDDAESIFEPISDESVPAHLKSYMNNLIKEEKSAAKDKTKIEIHFAHESVLKTNSANNVIGFFPPETIKPEKKNDEEEDKKDKKEKDKEIVDISNNSFIEKYEKSISTAELYSLIASKLDLDPSKVRLWRCGYGNLPVRIIPNSETSNVAGVSDGKNYMTVFIQSMKEELNEKLDIGDKYMIYLKFFFSEDLLKKQTKEIRSSLLDKQLHAPLQFLFSTSVKRDDKVESLVPLINEKLGFPKDSKLDAYQETLNKTVTKEKLTTVFKKSQIGSGSTLIFEMNSESIEKIQQDSLKINFDFVFPKQLNELEKETKDKTQQLKIFKQNDLDKNKNPLKSIQNFIQGDNNITLEIYNYKEPEKPLFLIQFSRDIKISEAKKFIIKAVFDKEIDETDLASILLFRMKNDEIVKIEIEQLYSNQILRFHFNDEPPKGSKYHKVYFYISPFKGHKTQDFIKYIVEFSADAKSIDVTKSIYLPNSCKCGEIFDSLKSLITEEEKNKNDQIKEMFNDNNKYRYLVIDSQLIERVFYSNNAVVPYEPKNIFRIEIIPNDQIDIDQDRLLRAYYTSEFTKGVVRGSQIIAPPFLIDVVNGEVFNDTKKRLKKLMDLSPDDDLKSYKFFLLIENQGPFDKQIEKRTKRAKSIQAENPDANVCEIYEINKVINNNWVTLDDFAMISEFAEDNTFNQQLVIMLSKKQDNNANDNDKQIKIENKKDDNDNDTKPIKMEHKSNRQQSSKPHGSHNEVRIYN